MKDKNYYLVHCKSNPRCNVSISVLHFRLAKQVSTLVMDEKITDENDERNFIVEVEANEATSQ